MFSSKNNLLHFLTPTFVITSLGVDSKVTKQRLSFMEVVQHSAQQNDMDNKREETLQQGDKPNSDS